MPPLTPLAGNTQARRAEAGLSPSAALNDAFRRIFSGGQVMLTQGVAQLEPADRRAVIKAVQTFDAFTSGCDPYGDHDFGAVEHAGTRYFWKNYAFASPDPNDPAVTCRVLTVMRNDEY